MFKSDSPSKPLAPDYPLQDTRFDLPLDDVLALSAIERRRYVRGLVRALDTVIRRNDMALKRRTPFKVEMRDLRRLLRASTNKYLRLDQRTSKRNVLMTGAPGKTHTYWSRNEMWKMATRFGDLNAAVRGRHQPLLNRLDRLLDPTDEIKQTFRKGKADTLPAIYAYLQQQYNSGTAFPPFHARFLADRYLPKETDSIIVDPCAGFGGRLLGTLCVPRATTVRYFGVDPNRNNREAYAGLTRRATVWLKREIQGPRSARVFAQPFEKWIDSPTATRLRRKVDLVMTSPPYFAAEIYDPASRTQSANRYREYEQWHDHFFRPLVRGAYRLLKRGGVFVLNIADVTGAPLERDTRKLAREAGFESLEFFKLAMSRSVGTRTKRPRHAVQIDGTIWKHEPVFVFRKP